MITFHDVEQGTPEWHALRRGKVTASNAYVLLTRGRNAATGGEGVSGGGYWAQRGHILEREAVEIYGDVYKCEPKSVGFIENDGFPGCGYSPDDVLPSYPLEVKCFKEEKHLACFENTPPEVYAQCQFGLMIGEYEYIDLIHYNPDVDDPKKCFRVIRIFRDEILIRRFKQILGFVK